ncbi:hypothetical protein ACFPA8_26395 [Streptomyces ovatisporus]|uniref:Uncharacterized protein n=1 Tax=Streptomyces ovatisporus TaxID=1128682 RepID=A0ABV9ACS9_9ACTN
MERALGTTDGTVAYQTVQWHLAAKLPPKGMRPQSAVFPSPPAKTFGQRCGDAFLGFVGWLSDPFPWLGDWIYLFRIRSKKKKIQEKRLKGGWRSIAGGLMAKNFIAGHHVLVAGQRTLSLVYVGPTESELAWSAPLGQLTGIQIATWDLPKDNGATLRCHFTDGSWADVKAVGAGWKQFVDHLPSHTP